MKYGESSRHAQKIMAFEKIHADFKDILKREKCRTCACSYGDVLNSVYKKIKKFQEIESYHQLVEIEDDFERWLKEADLLQAHG